MTDVYSGSVPKKSEKEYFNHVLGLNRWNLTNKQGEEYADGGRPSKINIQLKESTIQKLVIGYTSKGEALYNEFDDLQGGEGEKGESDPPPAKKSRILERGFSTPKPEKKKENVRSRRALSTIGMEGEVNALPPKIPAGVVGVESSTAPLLGVLSDVDVTDGESIANNDAWMAMASDVECEVEKRVPAKVLFKKRVEEAQARILMKIIMSKAREYCAGCNHEVPIVLQHVIKGRTFNDSLSEHIATPVVKGHLTDCMMSDFVKFFIFHASFVNQILTERGFESFLGGVFQELDLPFIAPGANIIGGKENLVAYTTEICQEKFELMKNTKNFYDILKPIVSALQMLVSE